MSKASNSWSFAMLKKSWFDYREAPTAKPQVEDRCAGRKSNRSINATGPGNQERLAGGTGASKS